MKARLDDILETAKGKSHTSQGAQAGLTMASSQLGDLLLGTYVTSLPWASVFSWVVSWGRWEVFAQVVWYRKEYGLSESVSKFFLGKETFKYSKPIILSYLALLLIFCGEKNPIPPLFQVSEVVYSKIRVLFIRNV